MAKNLKVIKLSHPDRKEMKIAIFIILVSALFIELVLFDLIPVFEVVYISTAFYIYGLYKLFSIIRPGRSNRIHAGKENIARVAAFFVENPEQKGRFEEDLKDIDSLTYSQARMIQKKVYLQAIRSMRKQKKENKMRKKYNA